MALVLLAAAVIVAAGESCSSAEGRLCRQSVSLMLVLFAAIETLALSTTATSANGTRFIFFLSELAPLLFTKAVLSVSVVRFRVFAVVLVSCAAAGVGLLAQGTMPLGESSALDFELVPDPVDPVDAVDPELLLLRERELGTSSKGCTKQARTCWSLRPSRTYLTLYDTTLPVADEGEEDADL